MKKPYTLPSDEEIFDFITHKLSGWMDDSGDGRFMIEPIREFVEKFVVLNSSQDIQPKSDIPHTFKGMDCQ